jgi:hypothetical protein
MKLEGYILKPVTPWETGSGGQAIECPADHCAASFRYDGAAGWYTIHVQYFDRNDGVSHFRLSVAISCRRRAGGSRLCRDRAEPTRVPMRYHELSGRCQLKDKETTCRV